MLFIRSRRLEYQLDKYIQQTNKHRYQNIDHLLNKTLIDDFTLASII